MICSNFHLFMWTFKLCSVDIAEIKSLIIIICRRIHSKISNIQFQNSPAVVHQMVQSNGRDITTTTNYTKGEHAIARKQSQTCPLEKRKKITHLWNLTLTYNAVLLQGGDPWQINLVNLCCGKWQICRWKHSNSKSSLHACYITKKLVCLLFLFSSSSTKQKCIKRGRVMDNKRRKEKERGGKHLPFNPAKIAGSGFRRSRRKKEEKEGRNRET